MSVTKIWLTGEIFSMIVFSSAVSFLVASLTCYFFDPSSGTAPNSSKPSLSLFIGQKRISSLTGPPPPWSLKLVYDSDPPGRTFQSSLLETSLRGPSSTQHPEGLWDFLPLDSLGSSLSPMLYTFSDRRTRWLYAPLFSSSRAISHFPVIPRDLSPLPHLPGAFRGCRWRFFPFESWLIVSIGRIFPSSP